MAGARF